MKGKKLFLYSLTSLAVIASSAASAEEFASAPSLEGGWSGMLGGFLFVPSTNDQAYAIDTDASVVPGAGTINNSTVNNNADYQTGWQAAIGYVFDETANGIELSYRNFDGSSDGNQGGSEVNFDTPLFGFGAGSNDGTFSNQDNVYENWDLMVSQFLDIGTHVQMRFLGGLSYLSDLNQTTNLSTNMDYAYAYVHDVIDVHAHGIDVSDEMSSRYSGLGPRVGMDARYDFGDMLEGFGIVGGASLAYFLGELENKNDLSVHFDSISVCRPDSECPTLDDLSLNANGEDQNDNHAVTNLRANLGIDYVYYFEDQDLPTLGLELGYEVDTFFDGVGSVSALGGETDVTDVTFSGPYLNIKGVF